MKSGQVFAAVIFVIAALGTLSPTYLRAQQFGGPGQMDPRAVIATCYSMGATTPSSMAMCSGKNVTHEQFVSCMQGRECFGAPIGVMQVSSAPIPQTVQDRSCGTAGRLPCAMAFPCGFQETIECPMFAYSYGRMVQVGGAYYCGTVGYPPCRLPLPCGQVGTLSCAPPPPMYMPQPGAPFAVPQEMRQASMLTFEPTVNVVIPPDIHTPGNFGESTTLDATNSFNFGGDNRPPNQINVEPSANMEFVPTAHPDLDRLQACKSSTSTQQAFIGCLTERAMPKEYRILASCAKAYQEIVKAWLCSSDDARLLQTFEKVESTVKCTKGMQPGSQQVMNCLTRNWMGNNEQAIVACFSTGTSYDAARSCLAQTSLTAHSGPYVQCAVQGGTADAIASCVGQRVVGERFPSFEACVQQPPNPVSLAKCFATPFAGLKEKQMLACVETASADVASISRCIGSQTMGKKEIAYLECATTSQGNKTEWARCFGKQALGRGERIYLDCALQGGGNFAVSACAGRTFLGSQSQNAYLQCAVTASESTRSLASCLGPLALGERENTILNCAMQQTNVASCVAQQYLGQDEQHMLKCAVENNYDVGTTAVCAMGPELGLNPEMQIALTCAVASGGEPMTFAGCAGGQLGQRELAKCWQNGVGTDQGCYGPNNSIRKFFDGVDSQLRTMLGSNNDLYKVYNAYHKNVLSPGPNHEFVKLVNSGINDLRSGPGKNNEIRKAATAVEKGFHKVRKATRIKIKL
jgi:hypothetical protein